MKAKAAFRVNGLAEPGLVRGLEEKLSAVAGVEYAHVNLGAGKVTVEFDDCICGPEALLAVVRSADTEAEQE